MLLYIIKSAITLALLYSCFFFFLSKETFHRFNRFMLMGIMVASLIVPLFHFTTEHPTVVGEEFYNVQSIMEEDAAFVFAPSVAEQRTLSVTWMQMLTWVYLAGVAIMLMLTGLQLYSLCRLTRGGLHHTDEYGNTVILNRSDIPPFSILHFIVMNVKDYEAYHQYILTHEQEHIRLGHTYDLLLLEVMKVIQWFNPFVWFLSRDLKAVHEYEADQAVINQGIDAKSYQQLLVMKVVGNRLQPFTNNLNHGSLKKRILMMYQKPSNRWLMLKALCAIPVVALALNTFATPTSTDPVEDIVSTLENTEVPLLNEPQRTILPAEETPILSVEKPSEEKRPFTIHPVRDSYGRVVGFSHEGEPADADKDFNCTYEYVFINDRQATEEEVRNYKDLLSNAKFSMLKTANGTAKYNYKDKKGIICLTTENAEKQDENPLIVMDGKIVNVPLSFQQAKSIEDDDVLKLLNLKSKDDIASVTVLQGAAATAIYGERGKNGVIEIKTKAGSKSVDAMVQKLPGAQKNDDGTVTINGKAVKKIIVEGDEVYNNDDDPVFDVCEEIAQYPGGTPALMQFITQHVRYPKIAQENGIHGRILVQFVVNKDGSCSNYKVLNDGACNMEGVKVTALAKKAQEAQQTGADVTHTPEELQEMSKSLEEEAIRVLRLAGKWQPAKQRGQVVRMKMTIPVTFRLH
ncbi:MAG: energy transducer TonB [Bacteroidaceae bacterium]|nr:energy transducer TonB [Bacteroidaceae bacterium]